MNAEETEIEQDGKVVSKEYNAEGEAKISEKPFSFNAGILYDNFDERNQYFDGTIDIILDGGNVISVKFTSASVGKTLDDQGFYTILPSPLQGQIISGEQKYENVTGNIE